MTRFTQGHSSGEVVETNSKLGQKGGENGKPMCSLGEAAEQEG